MQKQSTSTVVMVRPDHFGFNPQTALTNPFQHTPQMLNTTSEEIRKNAVKEFETMVKKLRENDIEVLVLPNNANAITPDAVFPNNWFSVHQDGKLVFYPLLNLNRRLERRQDVLLDVLKKAGRINPEIIDLSHDEEKGSILESTGSMIFDRIRKVAFAMASPRTSKDEFEKWCKLMDYEEVFITTPKNHVKEVYHTNIVMSIGTDFAIICLDVISDEKEKEMLRQKLKSLGKEIIEISLEQIYQFCGNILELQTKEGKKIIVMSETAKKAFTKEQRNRLKKYGKIVSFAIPTIEEVGGGGVRCMIGEIF